MTNHPCTCREINEIFELIGSLVCDFANFEGRLAPILAQMLNDNGNQASAILGQVDSFAYKWGTVLGVAETLGPASSNAAKAVLSIDASVRKVNGFRNKLAHSGSRIQYDPPMLCLIVNATTIKRGDPRIEHIDANFVQVHLDLIRECMTKLDDSIEWEKLTGTRGLMRALQGTFAPTTDFLEQQKSRRTRSQPPNPPQSSEA